MGRPKKQYFLSLTVTKEMYDKAQRLAESRYCPVSTVIRQLLAEAPEPQAKAS